MQFIIPRSPWTAHAIWTVYAPASSCEHMRWWVHALVGTCIGGHMHWWTFIMMYDTGYPAASSHFKFRLQVDVISASIWCTWAIFTRVILLPWALHLSILEFLNGLFIQEKQYPLQACFETLALRTNRIRGLCQGRGHYLALFTAACDIVASTRWSQVLGMLFNPGTRNGSRQCHSALGRKWGGVALWDGLVASMNSRSLR